MSDTQSSSRYSFDFSYSDPFTDAHFAFDVSAAAAFGDADAFALLAALKAAFPAGLHVSGQVLKVDSSATQYVTDLVSDPPAFT